MNVPPRTSDKLLSQLKRSEAKLNAWTQSSPANAELFRQDPVAALRAAGLGLDQELLRELEQVIEAIRVKLKASA